MITPLTPHLLVLTPQNSDPTLPWPNCWVYALVADDHLVLIDSGNSYAVPSLRAMLEAQHLTDRRNKYLFLTHCHFDHAGGAVSLVEDFHVHGVPLTAEILAYHPMQMLYEASEIITPVTITPLASYDPITIGPWTLTPIPTPGHTGDSTSYAVTVDGRRCLCTGDLIMPEGPIGWQGSVDFSLEQTMSSLAWLAEAEFDLLLTGHGIAGPEVRDTVRATLAMLQAGR